MMLLPFIPLLLLLITLLSQIHPTNSVYWNGFEYRDLIATTSTTFASESSVWTVSLLQTASTLKYTLCGSTYLLGGYNVLGTVANSYPGGYFGSSGQYGQYFSRLYSALPTHSWVYFTMTFWTIDYWKGPSSCAGSPTCQDHWDITVGGTTFSGWVLDQSYYNSLSSSCGNSASDLPNIRIFGRVAHTATSLTFTITSRLAQSSSIESWGVRNVNFLFVTSPTPQGSSQDICAFAPVTLPSSPISTCDCYSEGNYKQGNGVGVGACKVCDPACSSCFDAGPSNCFQCASGYYWDGTQCALPPICSTLCATCTGTASNQCLSCVPGAFLYNGNSCIPSCNPPLVQGLALGITTCSLPCGPDLFLDWLGNCIPFCDFPLNATWTSTVIGDVFTCVYPCATTEYLYWDGSCRTSCDTSFYLPNVISLRNFCNWTCTTSPNIILYWDGTCGSSCAFPLDIVFQYNRTYCDYPCATGQYLYNNGSCLSYCQAYFISYTAHGELFCNFPCSSTQYLLDTGSCVSTCNVYYTNLTMVGDKYCYYPCLPNQYFYTNGSCLSTCDWRFNYVVTNGQNFCNFPCGSNYLYLNGTCASYCTPYYTAWFDNRRYCDNPCNNTYMYGNGTCSSTCDTTGYFLVVPQGSDLTCIFPCRPSEYLYSNGSCLLSCRPFFIPLLYGTDHFCNYPCNNTASEYLYYNGSCVSSCNSPYISSAIGSDHFCDLPCRSNEYYYLNGSCIAWCPSTFIEHSLGIEMYCNYPCAPLEYLYANGSCLSSCRSDYIVKTYGTDLFCEFPCETNDYLYDNVTCLSTCSSSQWTLVQDNSNLYCRFPCSDATAYSYANGTCSSSCSFPFIASSDGAYKFCLSPCNSTEYLFIDNTCVTSCSSPFTVIRSGDANLCTSSCSSSYYLLINNGSCLATCPFPFKSSISPLNTLLCSFPCDDPLYYYYPDSQSCSPICTQQPNTNSEGYLECLLISTTTFLDTISSPPESPDTISLIVLAKIVQHIRYIDIKLPSRLENLRYGHGKYPLSLQYGLPMPSTLEAKFINYPLPTIFSEFHSSFLVNFWQSLTLISLCILAGLILFFLEISFRYLKIDYWRIIFERLGVLFRWNVIIILIAFNADFISLYSSFEFRTFTSFESVANAFSFFICSIICLVSLCIPIASYFFSCSISEYKSQALNSKSFKSYLSFLGKYQSLQVLFRGFNTNSSWTTIFYCIYFCRIFSPMAIAGYLYFSPLTQTIMHSVISILIVLYLIILRPMNRMINNIQLISIETSILVINICMLLFAIYDTFEIEPPENLTAVANIVIISNFCINVLLLVFLALKILFIVRAAWVLRKKDDLDTISVLLQIISLPFQQSCYGFEQLQFVRFDDTYYDLDEDYYTQKKFDHEIEMEEKLEKEREKESEPNTNIAPPLIVSATELPNESIDMLNRSSSYSSRHPMLSQKANMRSNFSYDKKDSEIFIPLPEVKILEDPHVTRDFSWISEVNNEGNNYMIDQQVDDLTWQEEMNQQVMVDPGEMSNEEDVDVGDGEREYQVREGEDGRMEVDFGREEKEFYPKMSRVPTEIMRDFGENNQMVGEMRYAPEMREVIGPFSPIEYEGDEVARGERMIYRKV